MKMATLRAECAKYLSALTSDNAYALYRDAVDIVARFSGVSKSDVTSGDELWNRSFRHTTSVRFPPRSTFTRWSFVGGRRRG